MTKLQKYNQKLLAVIGTLGLIGISILIIAGTIALISEFFIRENNQELRDNSLTLVQEKVEVDSTKVNQKITFESPKLIDTLKTIYLIPISQVNIQNNKNGKYQESNLVSGGKGRYGRKNSYYRYNGEYNNIMLYNEKENTKNYIFKEKIYITNFSNRIINEKQYLIIKGAIKDTNKDNKLNEDDLKVLYIYSLEQERKILFEFKNLSYIDTYLPFNTNKLLSRYTIDDNLNGEVNQLQEPVIIKEIDLKTFIVKDFISENEINSLTKIIN